MARWTALLVILILCANSAWANLVFKNTYSSPKNSERSRRANTDFIILHTTEAEADSSLQKLSRNGEAHYCVTRDGKVYRIVQRDRVAYHCGKSMWNGVKNLDDVSIGIEVVGYHDKALTSAQYITLKELIYTLQRAYGVKDANVMPHSQVAYGTPNRWHPKSHRGRKRCGMSYATPGIRNILGLKERWLSDPDVKMRRLVVGDDLLAKVLYSPKGNSYLPFKIPTITANTQVAAAPIKTKAPTPETSTTPKMQVIATTRSAWDIARDAYNAAETLYIFPNGKRITGDKITNWSAIDVGTKVIVGSTQAGSPIQILAKGVHPAMIIGDAVKAADTWYVRPTGGIYQGNNLTDKMLASMPPGTQILVGYSCVGIVKSNLLPAQLCPTQWDAPDTCYLIPGKPLSSYRNTDMRRIPPGTRVFCRN